MAFTAAQLTTLRSYLGYPDLNRFRDTRLESAFDVVGANAESKTLVESLMAAIALCDGLLATDGAVIQSAGLKRAEDIEWYANVTQGGTMSAPMAVVMTRGKMLLGRLSTLFGMPLWGDYFGGRGYAGDGFMGAAHQYGPNLIRMG